MLCKLTLVASLLLAIVCPVVSQTPDAQTYEIVVLDVSGCQHTEAEAVRQLSGLRIGDKVTIPGLQTYRAVRRLLAQELFETVEIVETRSEHDLIWLQIQVVEAPRIASWRVTGRKPSKLKEWQADLKNQFPEGSPWLVAHEQQLRQWVENRLSDQGYAYDQYKLMVWQDSIARTVTLDLELTDAPKVKLGQLTFTGNTHFSDHQLQKAMGIPSLRLSSIRPTEDFFDLARQQLLAFYQRNGYADAQVTSSQVTEEGARWHWQLEIEEGTPYYVGRINWRGAERYEKALLADILGIQTGEPYSRERLETRLHFDPKGDDISALYMNYGHLFFQAEAVETGIRGDTIDLEIQLIEGPIAIISDVDIVGNDRTSDEVILRELYTQPGQAFSRENVIRSQRALLALGYFNPESLNVATDINPQTGEVAITYEVEEERNDRLELAASFNPGSSETAAGLVGTVGFSLNNFSLRGLLEDGWQHAQGGGQQLSLRAQSSGAAYQGYNFAFTDPWFRGKPQSFSFGAYFQRFADTDSLGFTNTLAVTGLSAGWGKRLSWGRGGWALRGEVGYQHIRLNNLLDIQLDDGTALTSGRFNNLYLQLKLNYQNLDDPFFPTQGSRLEISGQWTPPFTTSTVTDGHAADAYRWLTYHKYRITGEKYLPLAKNLVLKGSAKMGWLAGYDPALGAPPFERFELGGDGNSGSQQAAFAGNDILALRGYERSEIAGTANGGGVAFAKFTAELRYQFLNRPSTRGYLIAFAEGGNAWKQVRDFNPLDLQRSAGLGIRLQLPMFGTIGLDYGLGLDKEGFRLDRWSQYGRVNLVFGFEPE